MAVIKDNASVAQFVPRPTISASFSQSRGEEALFFNYKVKPEEVKQFYERFGPIKDVYLPTDFYTHKPRGFGFVEFENEKDAREALEQTDGNEVLGSTVKVVFAREGRKAVRLRQPGDMKRREEHYRRRRSHSRERSRRHSRSHRSRSPRRRRHSSSSGSKKRSP